MAAFNRFNAFAERLAEGAHHLGADTLRVLLTNTAPLATDSVRADLTELADGNGYTAGGNATSVTSSAQTSGVYKLVLADPPTWTASGGTIGPFRYAVLYNDSAAADDLIGWWDYGASLTLQEQETFRVDFDLASGVLTIG